VHLTIKCPLIPLPRFTVISKYYTVLLTDGAILQHLLLAHVLPCELQAGKTDVQVADFLTEYVSASGHTCSMGLIGMPKKPLIMYRQTVMLASVKYACCSVGFVCDMPALIVLPLQANHQISCCLKP
jgi:hypothetical protein